MLFKRKFHVIQGRVQACDRDEGESRERVRQTLVVCEASGLEHTMVIRASNLPVGVGHEVSVVVAGQGSRARVVAVIDRTALAGVNFIREENRSRPDTWDAVIVSAGIAGATAALGSGGLVMLLPVAFIYWLFSYKVPGWYSCRVAQDIDIVADRAYRTRIDAARTQSPSATEDAG